MKNHWYQHIIPLYGNWGGPGWSGGKFVDDKSLVDWEVVALDRLDLLLKEHDYAYQHGTPYKDADYKLLWDLKFCPVRGWWANAYRVACIFIFSIKVKMYFTE